MTRGKAGFNGCFSIGLSEFQMLLKRVHIVYENSMDPDQLASYEAS